MRELSLGERMKLELVAALLHEPEVLFLDEPTIGLDVVAQHTIHDLPAARQAERQMTVILTTHYMKDVAALCERVVVITGGEILYDGSLAEIVDRFTTHKIVTLDFEPSPPGRRRAARLPCEIRGPRVDPPDRPERGSPTSCRSCSRARQSATCRSRTCRWRRSWPNCSGGPASRRRRRLPEPVGVP